MEMMNSSPETGIGASRRTNQWDDRKNWGIDEYFIGYTATHKQIQGDFLTEIESNQLNSLTFQSNCIWLQRACGSLQNLLKIRGGADDIESNESDGDKNDDGNKLTNPNEGNASAPITPAKRSSNDMEQKMSSQVDNLDSLLTKVENAHYSMSHQKKQMKSMLQK